MHILGKVLIWIVMLLIIAAWVLTARMLQVRNSWAKHLHPTTGLEKTYDDNAAKIRDLQRQLRELELELTRANFGWGRYFDGVQIAANNLQPGALTANIGTTAGLTQNLPVHVFQPNPDGDYLYVGPFRVTQVNPDASALLPDWKPVPPEADYNGNGTLEPEEDFNKNGQPDKGEWETWNYGENWRLRPLTPSANEIMFLNQARSIAQLLKDISLAFENLQRQREQLTAAEDNLKLRLAELNGDPALEGKRGSLDDHVIDGLVVAIKNEEEVRNNVLGQVDQLRRDVKHAFERYNQLRQANRQLVQSLPAPKPAAGNAPGP